MLSYTILCFLGTTVDVYSGMITLVPRQATATPSEAALKAARGSSIYAITLAASLGYLYIAVGDSLKAIYPG